MARVITGFVPHLWYVKEAREAARFYTRIFPRSRIDRTGNWPAPTPWTASSSACSANPSSR